MKRKVSIAIIPSEKIITLVDLIKTILFDKIGWYHSRNSKAHITISEFEADEKEIHIISSRIKETANETTAINVKFENIKSFENGALFIGPNEDSRNELKAIMKKFYKTTNSVSKVYKSYEPHISIGRRIEEGKLKIAFEIIKSIKFMFHCDTVAIRVFNEDLKQYEIKERFPLNGNPSNNGGQTSLF
ncbi:2'-5' RNA ligase family protein [Flavobacterium capsici]|uniref:2'-5' RNA ligase family protein n=1 Tax=Flavobacterium capsici TaxID=3075618 RepID=A0AA96F105_9FLAO|nr:MULTISPECIES: 2'-5' RNA ligase family protein [unclassified Flavobacterium]WNM17761.1 2'-5' RNA ligase family protein [Flavobacterium sp. PMR2A8]WNM21814.1 2'-5' RNA ligase family protein [Flavobacterium sp. PMTSA4]